MNYHKICKPIHNAGPEVIREIGLLAPFLNSFSSELFAFQLPLGITHQPVWIRIWNPIVEPVEQQLYSDVWAMRPSK